MNVDRTVAFNFGMNSPRIDSSNKRVDLTVTDAARDVVPEKHDIIVTSSPEIQQLLTGEEVSALRDSFFVHNETEVRDSGIASKTSAGMYNIRGESATQNPIYVRGVLLDIVG
tara:strand:+ start:2618 stop:2956 length:339 start_codon:yes stop_codon:yes gene_type:complete